MKHWKTQEIIDLVRSLGYEEVTYGHQGGDHDTEVVIAEKNGNDLFIRGFRADGEVVTTPDDTEVEMIEVRDGLDSRGGLCADDEEFCIMYARIVSALRKNGFSVVPAMDDYF